MRVKRSKGKRKKGRDYEKLATKYFADKYSGFFVPHPWFFIKDSWGPRWLQPDGLLIQPQNGKIVIVEYKLKHTPDAWFQLLELYRPVVEKLFPPKLWSIRACEVVRWYDAAVYFPGKCVLRRTLTEVQEHEVGVLIWIP